MIAELSEASRSRFLCAVCHRPYFGDVLPVHLAVFGLTHPFVRFYMADGAAMQVKGRSALICGTYDRQETGAFLQMLGVCRVNTDGDAPVGYRLHQTLYNLVLAPNAPTVPRPQGRLELDREPSAAQVTDFLMRREADRSGWDNFYAELCAKRVRGAAVVWAVRLDGQIVSTAGAYALSSQSAYLAAIETHEALRGRGIGGWLTGMLAADLAASGRRVTLTCAQERLPFYSRLGFVRENTVSRCAAEQPAAQTDFE